VPLLLLSLDRLPSNQLTMTQELIANMLGVRREGSPKPPQLHKLGVIRYVRGQITVLDRPRLNSCVASVMPWSGKRAIASAARGASVR